MNSEQITAFLQEHWYIASVIIGVVILIGAIRNWNWLCDPTGKPDSHRYGRGSRRVIFFLLGVLLIVVSIWGFMLKLQ
ncbi:immunity 17 family protein [Pseudoflavonifractor sp. DSM 107456]|uniref:Immunity 17 family protein n=1 Tax=Pseudoflavonifractor gallinarum TaxID=2779352 RepID=A0ABR9R9U0_9FIRM|nr:MULTISPECIES: Imm17 family immunity protein [Oscillospiraceae]MBE5055461.1 immunity 17 family protein [Pseudoflavonifractor gallinarum]MDY4167504.1 Imm17 family immunity protein [Fournierella sp.]